MKILLIEDETELQETIRIFLEKEYHVVETACDFATAQEKTDLYVYDCILLDITLPGGSGLEILNHLKNEGKESNIIIISARDSLDDKLKGLEAGADDYLTKPFHLAELNARIKAVLRRNNMNGKNSIEVANLIMDPSERLLLVDGKNCTLNRKEFDILNYFLLNKNRLITKTALAEHVWGDDADQEDSLDFVYYQIKNLRKKLSSASAKVEIQSHYGIGYKLVEP